MCHCVQISSLMLISVEGGRIMILTNNIILLIFLCVICTSAQSQLDIEFNNLIASGYEVKLLDNLISKNNRHVPEKVRLQLYYECLCPYCKRFYIDELAPFVETMSPHLNIATYPFGNARIIDDNGKVEIKCQHGPAECYGNKLHACAIYSLQHTTALLYNTCLMNSTDGLGSDDKSADRCAKSMNVNSEPIKDCAKGDKGMELLRNYGEESKKANFNYVPYVLINGEEFQGDNFKEAVCDAFTNPPPFCK